MTASASVFLRTAAALACAAAVGFAGAATPGAAAPEFTVADATGKAVKLPRCNVWVPYIWTLGIMVFSSGGFISGAGGEPRRTNLGVSYADPHSPLYHADWQIPRLLGSTGGVIMTIGALLFFIIFFATLFGKATKEGVLELIVSEPYHDERVPAVQSFTPWLAGAALLLVIAYAPPITQTIRSRFPGAPAYSPQSPLPLKAAPGR